MENLNLKFDFPAILNSMTGLDGWERAKVPPPKPDEDEAGVRYGFKIAEEHEAIITLDDTFLRVVMDEGFVYGGDWTQDPEIRNFVEGDLPPLEDDDLFPPELEGS